MKFSTADLCDRYPDDIDVLEHGLQHFGGTQRFAGPIATLVALEDTVLVREALAEPGAGRILVVDGGGSDRRALIGDQLAAQALANGWVGIVINGFIRDRAAISKIDLGVLALGTCPMASGQKGEGRRNEMLRFNGVSMTPGQFLYADEDGVVLSERELV